MQKIIQEFKDLSGITLTSRQLAALDVYQNELMEWNTRHNLTAIREPEQVRVKHFLDSSSEERVGKRWPERSLESLER